MATARISAAGIVKLGFFASPAMSMAWRKPMKAKITPPLDTAARMPCTP